MKYIIDVRIETEYNLSIFSNIQIFSNLKFMAIRQIISMFEQMNIDERMDAYDCNNLHLGLLLHKKT